MKILVIGSSNVDINVFLDKLPLKGETLLGDSMRYSYGGKGANQALACGKLGADVSFLSAVGDDDHGHTIIDNLSKYNVISDKIKISKDNVTGTALITIDANGDNTIVVVPSANYDCDLEYLKENDDEFKKSDFVLLQMEIPLESIEYSIRKAKEYEKTVILNPAPVHEGLDKDLFKMIDYLTPNETELDVLSRGLGDFDTIDEKIDALLEAGVKNIITTLGEKGAYLVNKDTRVLVPAIKVKALDTVGAGDCFNGAFVSALANNTGIEEAIKFANQAASIAVTRLGAQEAIPTLEEVKEVFE